jgi:hypothetical protein
MKTIFALCAAIGIGFTAMTALSQAPAAPGAPAAPAAKAPMLPLLQQLQAIRDQNAKLLEQQAATLKTLEDMEKTVQQIKAFGKRS